MGISNYRKIGLYLGLVLIIAASILIGYGLNGQMLDNLWGRPGLSIDSSRTEVVRDIQSLERLITTTYSVEKVIEAGTDGNVFQEILYGDQLLLIAHGRVSAGVDLSKVTHDSVEIDGSRVRLELPPTQVFDSYLLEDRTEVYDRDMGLLSKGDKDLESKARQAAAEYIVNAACEDGILATAADDAKKYFEDFFAMLDFQEVEIVVSAGECVSTR